MKKLQKRSIFFLTSQNAIKDSKNNAFGVVSYNQETFS